MEEVILLLSAYITSTLSGVIGMGGGILLLTIMAYFFKPIDLIPIHGIIQFCSNISRAYFNRIHLLYGRVILLFGAGALVGAAVGSQFIVELDPVVFRWVLAIFILVMTWKPKLKGVGPFKGEFFILGVVTSFLSLFVGATGPLKAPFFLNKGFKKEEIVASKAGCQTLVHGFKLVTYFFLGFTLGDRWPLVSGMVVAVFAGSATGKLLLGRLPEKTFMWVFKGLITVLALRMIYQNL